MTRLSLATLTACLLAAPVLASQGPVATDQAAGPTPTLIVAQCPGKPPVNAYRKRNARGRCVPCQCRRGLAPPLAFTA